jgi:membrane protein implicated in regulation of membrane protease activity
VPHLRPPSIDHGVASFLWAAGFGMFIYLGLVAVGISQADGVILAALSFAAIFLYVRIFGEQELRQPTSPREDGP